MLEDGDEFVDRAGSLSGVTEVSSAFDGVLISPTDARAMQIAVGHQIGQYLLRRALGDAHPLRDVAHADLRVGCHREQHMRVITQEGPHPFGSHCWTVPTPMLRCRTDAP